MTRRRRAVAFAPASVANTASGFDILGHALEGVGDRVTASLVDDPGVRIEAIRGSVPDLPLDPDRNTAGAAVQSMIREIGTPIGVALEIEKGIPLGSGMGGSAASAVAALVAVNALLPRPFDRTGLYPFALAGEAVACGSAHGDNVGPQLLGGLVLATSERLIPIPTPDGLTCVVVHPHQVLETKRSREVLAPPFALSEVVEQSAHLALLLAGCYRGDLELIREGLVDVLIEPRRERLVPGFAAVKRAALGAGALGAALAGGGPSLFAWCRGGSTAAAIANAMRDAFEAEGWPSDVFVSPVAAPGAELQSCDT